MLQRRRDPSVRARGCAPPRLHPAPSHSRKDRCRSSQGPNPRRLDLHRNRGCGPSERCRTEQAADEMRQEHKQAAAQPGRYADAGHTADWGDEQFGDAQCITQKGLLLWHMRVCTKSAVACSHRRHIGAVQSFGQQAHRQPSAFLPLPCSSMRRRGHYRRKRLAAGRRTFTRASDTFPAPTHTWRWLAHTCVQLRRLGAGGTLGHARSVILARRVAASQHRHTCARARTRGWVSAAFAERSPPGNMGARGRASTTAAPHVTDTCTARVHVQGERHG